MKKQNSQEEVFGHLEAVFENDNGDILLKLKKDAMGYKMSPTKVDSIWRRIFELEQLSIEQLCIIYTLIQRQRQYRDILPAPNHYFTDFEIREAEKIRQMADEEVKDTIVINNVMKLRDDMYSAVIKIDEIAKWDNNNKIIYNRETQRPTIWSRNNTEKNHLSKQNVVEIAEAIIGGTYFPDEIKLNLLPDIEGNSLIYNPSKKSLTVKGDLNIVDGYHRLAALQLALQRYPTCELCFPVTISHLIISDAQQLIVQRGKEQEIDRKYLDALENTAGNYIVKEIIKSPIADEIYSKKIVKTQEEIRFKRGFILFSELSQAIEKEYDLQGAIPLVVRNELRDWLIEFFNQLTTLLYHEWTMPRRKDWASKHYAFPGYIFLSAQLRGREDWKNILFNVMKEAGDSTVNSKGSVKKSIKDVLEKYVQ